MSKLSKWMPPLLLGLLLIGGMDGQQPAEIERLRGDVNSLAQRRQWDSAIEAAYKLRELTERQFGKNSRETADVLEALGALHQSAGFPDDAVLFYENMIGTLDTLPQHGGPRAFAVMDKMGVLYRKMNRLDAAEAIQKRELEFGRLYLPADPNLAYAYNGLGILYFNQGRYGEAEPLLKTGLGIRLAAPAMDRELIAVSADNLGQLYAAMDRFPEAAENFVRALPLFKEVLGETAQDTISCMVNLALAYSHNGHAAEGIDLLTAGLDAIVRQRGQNDPDAGNVLWRRGEVYLSERRFSLAEADLRRALAIAESHLGQDAMNAGILIALSDAHAAVNDYAQADAELERAQRIEERSLGPADDRLAPLYRRRGWANLRLSNADSAKSFLRKTLDIDARKHGANDLSVARDLHNLAQAYIAAGELAEAAPYLTRAIGINENLNSGVDLAENYNQLGSLRERLGDPVHAEEAYRQSVELFARLVGSDDQRTQNARTNLGLLLNGAGKAQEALQIAQARDIAFRAGLLHLLSSGTERQRISFVRSQNPFAFLGSLGAAEPLAEAVFNYKGVVADSLLSGRAAFGKDAAGEQKRAMDQWRQARRNLTQWGMEESTAPGSVTGRGEPDTLAADVALAEANLVRQGARVFVEADLTLKTADIQRRIPPHATLLDFIRYSHYLGEARWEDRYGAIVLAPQGKPAWVPLGSAAIIEAAVKGYDSSIRRIDPTTKIQSVARVLYDLLVDPIVPALPADTTGLLVSPDGDLNFVSFAALLTPDGQFVAERYSVTYIANARHLFGTPMGRPVRQMLVYADPQYRIRTQAAGKTPDAPFDSRFRYPVLEPLPFTATEAGALRRIAEQDGWRVTVRKGREATEHDLRNADHVGVLHLATHGFYLRATGTEMVSKTSADRGVGGLRPVAPEQVPAKAPGKAAGPVNPQRTAVNPQPAAEDRPGAYVTSVAVYSAKDVSLDDPMLRSGVALTGAQDTLEDWRNGKVPPTEDDGILNAEEAAMLDLNGVWLVTLSSCDSGLGRAEPGEGIYGLRRGFMQAGAQNVLTTLWPVNDAVTATLMPAFYRKALATGDAPAALAAAQKDALIRLRNEHGLDEAVRLAGAFVLTSRSFSSH